MAVAPFVSSAKKIKTGNKVLRELSLDQYTGIPTVPQILSSDPDDFIKLANIFYDMGYGRVNWNLGCPFSIVVKKGRGAGMLCHPERIEYFLEKTMSSVKPELSIKLRLGFSHPEDILMLLPIFNRFPLAELIIHPRTGRQMYTGEVDLAVFEQCLDLSQHKVVYNGDINSFQNFSQLAERFPRVDAWMIGRGLIGDPFLAEEIKFRIQKPYGEKVRILREFHDRLFAAYSKILSGPSHITNKMKEIWTYMGSFLEHREKIQKKIWKTQHRNNYIEVVDKIFADLI